MSLYLATPDGRYIVRGRLWRCNNLSLFDRKRDCLTALLMAARRAKGVAKRAEDVRGREKAKPRVEAAKIALGKRNPVWWTDSTSDVNRRMAKNSSYAAWLAAVEQCDHG